MVNMDTKLVCSEGVEESLDITGESFVKVADIYGPGRCSNYSRQSGLRGQIKHLVKLDL